MPEPVIHPSASAPDPATGAVLRRAAVADIDPRTLYLLAKLRQDVFAVEQKATDPDLDGRDLEPTTALLWVEIEREPVAHTRVLREADGSLRIGRVAVRAENRRDGIGGRIMRAALDVTHELDPLSEVHIDAQAYLERWYQALGCETTGEVFWEAGIEHVPMVFRHPENRAGTGIARG